MRVFRRAGKRGEKKRGVWKRRRKGELEKDGRVIGGECGVEWRDIDNEFYEEGKRMMKRDGWRKEGERLKKKLKLLDANMSRREIVTVF